MQSEHIALIDTLKASRAWVAAFNAGDARQCADTYIETALMETEPFGKFSGRDAIHAFWADLVQQGATRLQYHRPTLEAVDENMVRLSADWSMNIGHGRILRETWIREAGRWMIADDSFVLLGKTHPGQPLA